MIIRLLGRPVAIDDTGTPMRVRGVKTWALMARILLSDQPVSRERLAEELFSSARDPMGALRWSLAQIRRVVADSTTFRGDPVEADLGPEVQLDVAGLDRLRTAPTAFPGRLLEGIDGEWSAEFDIWLAVERQRIESRVVGALRTATMRALSSRRGTDATLLARELVARAPFEEGSHVLLVRALVMTGDVLAARERVDACSTLFADELGTEPSPAVRAALREGAPGAPTGVSRNASANALLEAGTAAIDAGAVDAGIECLRRAVVDAGVGRDAHLRSRAQCALGSALVHGVRGFDDEGALALHDAVEGAVAASDAETAAMALRELGYVEALAGRRHEAAEYLDRALEMAIDQPAIQAGVLGYAGLNLGDWGRHGSALDAFREAIEVAGRAARRREEVFALTLGGRTLMQLGMDDEAREWLDRALLIANEERWLSFRPLIDVLRLETDRIRGREPLGRRIELERVFAASCELADPCWEGLAALGLGLTYESREDAPVAFDWFADARARCTRVTDTWMWVEAQALECEVTFAMTHGHHDHARAMGQRLLEHSARRQLDHHAAVAREILTSL